MRDGLRTYIDNVSCEQYGAELFHHNVTPCSITNYDEWLPNALNPIEIDKSVFRYSEINLVYFVTGRNETETVTKTSQLIYAHTKCVIKFEHTNFFYNCKLTSSETERISAHDYKVTIILQSSFKYKDRIFKLIKVPIEKLKNNGNQPTPLDFNIVVNIDISVLILKINNECITFKNLIKGDVIDFISKDFLVKRNGLVEWGFVDFWDMPILQNGINIVEFDNVNITVNIAYTPRFV